MLNGCYGKVKATDHPVDAPSAAFVGSHLAIYGRGSETVGDVLQPTVHSSGVDYFTSIGQLIELVETKGTVLDNLQGATPVQIPFPYKPVSFANPLSRDIHVRFPDGFTVQNLVDHQSDPDNTSLDNVSFEVKIPQAILVELFGMQKMESDDGYKIALLSAAVVEQTGLPISASIQLISNHSAAGETAWFPRNTVVMSGSASARVSHTIPANAKHSYHDAGNAGRTIYTTAGHVETPCWRRWATTDMSQLKEALVEMGQHTEAGRVTVLTLNTDKFTADTLAEYFLLTQFHHMYRREKKKNNRLETDQWVYPSPSKGMQMVIPEQVVLARFADLNKTVAPHLTLFYLNDVRVRITPTHAKNWKTAISKALVQNAEARFDTEENIMAQFISFGVTIRLTAVPVVSVRHTLTEELESEEMNVVE